MRIVFLGPPGSGKGTQARRLAERLSVPPISTGEMLREAVREGNPLGLKVKSIMESGDLVPDNLMIELIRERLARPDAQNGFILDGYPRTVEQAAALERMLSGNGNRLLSVVNLQVPETVILDRLHGRSAEEHRADDRPGAIAERLRVYHERTEPLIGYYRSKRLLSDVDGMGDVDEIGDRIGRVIERADRARGAA
jgi:adenylate kinase